MDRRRSRLAASLLAFAVLLPACGGPTPPPPVRQLSMKLTDSSTGFGLALMDRLLAEPDASNVFISPLSATLALSMAASAAKGDTRKSILTTLGLDPSVDPSPEATQTINRLMHSDENAQLELAQAVWAAKGLRLNPVYVGRLRDDYHAQIASLDFTSASAAKQVNDWVDTATHHKIPKLVDGFDPSTVAFLVNATYFHALWATEFKSVTQPSDFHTFSGHSIGVPVMKRDHDVTHLYTPDYQAALLPYKGGKFSMLLLLPNKSLSPQQWSTFLGQLTWNQALDLFHSAVGPMLGGTPCTRKDPAPNITVDCDSGLVMPKFTLDYSAELLPHLVAMGMAPGALPDISSGCFISRVVQKTHLEVDEKGTTAAAATGVVVVSSLRMPMVIDHPFALALIDNASDAPLFLGVIGQL